MTRTTMEMNKDSLIGHHALGNFKSNSQQGETTILSHDPIAEKELPLPFQYGGDIAANFVLAASTLLQTSTTPIALKPMSLHIEYVNPGDVTKIRLYQVEKLRQSHRFLHSTVRIVQDDDCVAFGTVTFHADEATPQSLTYTPEFPADCPPPDELTDDSTLLEQFEKRGNFQDFDLVKVRRMVFLSHGLGLTVRSVDPNSYFRLNTEPATRLRFWMRYRKSEIDKMFSEVEATAWSEALLAFASDYRIMSAALRQAPTFRTSKMATMSHSMWFAPGAELKNPTEWILYDTHLDFSDNNTVLCEGHLWNENKQLLAVAKQQGLVRPKIE